MDTLTKGDLEVRVIDVGNLYYCNIVDKNNNISSIQIFDIIFNLDEDKQKKGRTNETGPYKTRFRVDNRFFSNVKNNFLKYIEINIEKSLKDKIGIIYTKKEEKDVVFINDNYYPNKDGNKEIETPKPTTSDNNAEIGKLKVDKYRLEEELKRAKEALEKVTQSKYGQNELVNSLKEEIQKLEREKRDIEYEFSVLKRKFEEINKNNTDLGINIKAKDEQFISLRNTYSNLINEYDKLKAELNNKTNELEKIKNETKGNISTNRMNDIILKQINDNVNRLISYQFANTGDGTLHFTKITEVVSELLKTVQTIETKLKK